ncbi:MAG: YlzJ-like family protein [Firmicutes bacterium]|nr:YlzJ-like family protein [Bacillota bacterium]
MLWTVMPPEWVFEDDGGPRLAEVAAGAMRIVLEAGPGGAWRVQRVLSTNPFDYLRPELSPGALWIANPPSVSRV